MKVLIGSTLAPYKCQREEDVAWLSNAEQIRDSLTGAQVHFGVALELDGRGLVPYEALLNRLADLEPPLPPADDSEKTWTPTIHQWSFSIDTGATAYGSDERLARICTGRNLITEMAVRLGAEWIAFLDSDVRPPGDFLPRLFELGWPIVGGNIDAYCLSGPELRGPPDPPPDASAKWRERWAQVWGIGGGYDFPAQLHWNTAGMLLVHRDIFTQLRWRTDPEAGLTDDPCYAADALRLGWPTIVRHDIGAEHVVPLVGVEARGYDLDIRPA